MSTLGTSGIGARGFGESRPVSNVPEIVREVAPELNRLGLRIDLERMALELDEGVGLLSEDERWRVFEVAACQVNSLARLTPFLVGDLCIAAESLLGERASQLEALFPDYAPQTLANYCSVCMRVPPERRRSELSYRHHEAVASLPPEQQRNWLDRAVPSGWTVAQLREAIQADRSSTTGGSRPRPSTQLREAARRVWMLSLLEGDDYRVPREAVTELAAALGLAEHRQAARPDTDVIIPRSLLLAALHAARRYAADEARERFNYPDALYLVPALELDAVFRSVSFDERDVVD
jgi:hypothetical protein